MWILPLDYKDAYFLEVWRNSAANRGRLTSTRTCIWIAVWTGRWRKRKLRHESGYGYSLCVLFFQLRRLPKAPVPCMLPSGSPGRPTLADSRRSESWRPCVRACRGYWSTRTLYTGPPSSVGRRTLLTSGRSCGNGIWVLSDHCCHIPRPRASQHLLMEVPQTATTWRRSSGLFTTRQKNRLKVFKTRDFV